MQGFYHELLFRILTTGQTVVGSLQRVEFVRLLRIGMGFWCSVFIVCQFRGCAGSGSHFPLCATIWALTCHGLHRHLLTNGLFICTVLIPEVPYLCFIF